MLVDLKHISLVNAEAYCRVLEDYIRLPNVVLDSHVRFDLQSHALWLHTFSSSAFNYDKSTYAHCMDNAFRSAGLKYFSQHRTISLLPDDEYSLSPRKREPSLDV